jgi:hypothetical protein
MFVISVVAKVGIPLAWHLDRADTSKATTSRCAPTDSTDHSIANPSPDISATYVVRMVIISSPAVQEKSLDTGSRRGKLLSYRQRMLMV